MNDTTNRECVWCKSELADTEVNLCRQCLELGSATGPCIWRLDDQDQGVWESSCGNAFSIVYGSPVQNDMRFCPYCGHPMKEQP